MNNDVTALRAHLFNTLQALQDKDNPMDTDRARAICQVGDVIIGTAKVEIDFAKVNGSVDSQFFEKPDASKPNVTVVGNVTTHRLRG